MWNETLEGGAVPITDDDRVHFENLRKWVTSNDDLRYPLLLCLLNKEFMLPTGENNWTYSWARSLIMNEHRHVAEYVGHLPRMLDVGAGWRNQDSSEAKSVNVFSFDEHITLDIDASSKPDVVADITRHTGLEDESFDLVLCSQTLEHIFDYRAALCEMARLSRRWLHIDMPWIYPYHAEDGFGDWWRFSPRALVRMGKEFGFDGAHRTRLLGGVMSSVLLEKT